MIKVISVFKRRKGLTAKEFSDYWKEKHAPLVMKAWPEIRKYVQNHAVPLPGKTESTIDGIEELWFDDMKTWRRIAEFYLAPEGRIIREDEDKFLDREELRFFITQEIIIKE